MKKSDYIEVFVPTHIINANSNPYIENKMIEQTIVSCNSVLKMENVQFTIAPDASFKKSHPILMKKYEAYLNDMCKNLKKININARIFKNTGETLRGNWTNFVKECKKPYIFFLEHDWKFLEEIDVLSVIKTMEDFKNVNYIRLPKFDLDDSLFTSLASGRNWDWIFSEAKDIKSCIPLTRISFFSGNPHFIRTSFCKDFILPSLEKYCPPSKSKGASHLEKDIKKVAMYMIDEMRDCGFSNRNTDPGKSFGHQWPLSAGNSCGKGCNKCKNAIYKQHVNWGNFMYGYKEKKAIVGHLGDWCMKC